MSLDPRSFRPRRLWQALAASVIALFLAAFQTPPRQMGAELPIAEEISVSPDGNATDDVMKMLLQTFAIMGRNIKQYELRDADIVLRPLMAGVWSADFGARRVPSGPVARLPRGSCPI